MWIKICGNTLLEDCLHAAASGADAVGFIFAPGKRTVTPQGVARIVSELPSALEKVGVFTTGDPAVIAATVQQAALTGIQLHREYNTNLIHALKQQMFADNIAVQLIQVQTWNADEGAVAQMAAFTAACQRIADGGLVDRLLIDSRTGMASGGTGTAFDWRAAAPALIGLEIPVIVAGGLSPANVAQAIEMLCPCGVDVSSGVERAPGVKDHEAVEAFITNAREPRNHRSFKQHE